MKTLLWREWRWNRVVLIAGLVMFLLPYGIASLLLLWPRNVPLHGNDIAAGFAGSAVFSYAISQLTLAFLGGNAIAGERSDRTAEFLAYLPVSKLQRLLAKLSFIALITALIWGINWLVIGSLHDRAHIQIRQYFEPAKYIALGSFVMFGVAWLVSSFQSSPTFAVCAGVVAPILIMFCLWMVIWTFELGSKEQEHLFETVFPIVSLALGTLGFGAGSWYFLKRVEP